jgi:hypothetical protein
MDNTPSSSRARPPNIRMRYDLIQMARDTSPHVVVPEAERNAPDQVVHVHKTRAQAELARSRATSPAELHISIENQDEDIDWMVSTLGGLMPQRDIRSASYLPHQALQTPAVSVRRPNQSGQVRGLEQISATGLDNYPGNEVGKPLCKVCAPHDFSLYFRWRPPPGLGIPSAHLGPLYHVLRRDCPFCRLVVKAFLCDRPIPRTTYTFDHMQVVVTIKYQVLEVQYGDLARRHIVLPKDHLPEVSLTAGMPTVGPFLSRFVHVGSVNWPQYGYAWIKRFLDVCEQQHGDACAAKLCTRGRMSSVSDIMVIDVHKRCLVRREAGIRYLALSYVWGQHKNFQTKKRNLSFLLEPGSLSRCNIPRTIRDAMDVVSNLNERYLWVDALCIVQDDKKVKLELINQMNETYENALLTIVAAGGESCESSLFGATPVQTNVTRSVEVVDGLPLVWTPADLQSTLQESVYDTRGWTFQERLLSRRCLYFTDAQVYITCRLTSEREDNQNMELMHLQEDASFISSNPILTSRTVQNRLDTSPTHWHDFFWTYNSLLHRYTSRELTDPSDVLKALAGIMNTLENTFKTRFIYGLPEALLDIGLLWTPTGAITRRSLHDAVNSHKRLLKTGKRSGVKRYGASRSGHLAGVPLFSNGQRFDNLDIAIKATAEDGSKAQLFPSWSWAGWIGVISHSYLPQADHTALKVDPFALRSEINPFWVFRNNRIQVVDRGKSLSHMPAPVLGPPAETPDEPYQENALYFKACTTPSHNFRIHEPDERSTTKAKRPILDRHGRECGELDTGIGGPNVTTFSEARWFLNGQGPAPPRDFVLLSRSSNPVTPVQLIDSSQFPPWPWSLLNVMLVEWHGNFARRLAVGVIHDDAWVEGVTQIKEIRLV